MISDLTMATLGEILANADVEPGAARWDYSGRGMFDRTCFGIVGDVTTLARFLISAGQWYVTEEWNADYGGGCDGPEWDPMILATDLRVDDMGLNKIFYWPQLSFADALTPPLDLDRPDPAPELARVATKARFTPHFGGVGRCPCACNSGGFCGGCGHAGCGRR